jgi:hypothetical protein
VRHRGEKTQELEARTAPPSDRAWQLNYEDGGVRMEKKRVRSLEGMAWSEVTTVEVQGW